MAIWDKVKEGIDKAGKAAQEAFDEGKTRLEGYRVREQADKAAEALGYAVFRAAEGGRELETEARERLMRALREKDTEARRLEAELATNGGGKQDGSARPAEAANAADAAAAPSSSEADASAPPSSTV